MMTQKDDNALHEFYKTMRVLLAHGIPKRGAQRSFEELVYSVLGKKAWRPTHITKQALKEYIEGTNKKIQRAHGTYRDRLGRFERTLKILEGDLMSYEEWWSFFLYHDKTVLMTRAEHGSGELPSEDDLIETPDDSMGMFETSGFSARIRKRVEEVWMKEQYDIIFENTLEG